MRPDNPIRNFDPRKVAHYEKENYVAYYRKEWLKLFRVSVAMVNEDFDPAEAAKRDVNWWVIHRRLFGNPENQELVDAVACLYELVYGGSSEKFKEAAYQRVMGMLYSDRWVNEGKPAGSPLLVKE